MQSRTRMGRLNVGQLLHGILVLLSNLGNLHVDCASGGYSQYIGFHPSKVVIKQFYENQAKQLNDYLAGVRSNILAVAS